MSIITDAYLDQLHELARVHNRRTPQSTIHVSETPADLAHIIRPDVRLVIVVPSLTPAFMACAATMPPPPTKRLRMAFGMMSRAFLTGMRAPDYGAIEKIYAEEKDNPGDQDGPSALRALQKTDHEFANFLRDHLGPRAGLREMHLATLHGQTFFPIGHTDRISGEIFTWPKGLSQGFITNACIRGPGMAILLDAPTDDVRRKIGRTTFGELQRDAACPYDIVSMPAGAMVIGKLDPANGPSDESLFHWGTFGGRDRLGLTAFIGCQPQTQ